MDEDEYETNAFDIPADKLYAVVELVVDEPNEEGETDVETYVCPASTNWLTDVVRIENSDGQVKYTATCMWPKQEDKLTSLLEKRSKPSAGWKSYPLTRVLKFCRSIGQAKEQSNKAMYTSLSESDHGNLRKRRSVRPARYGLDKDDQDGHNADDDTDSEQPPLKSLKIMSKGGPSSRAVNNHLPSANKTNSSGSKDNDFDDKDVNKPNKSNSSGSKDKDVNNLYQSLSGSKDVDSDEDVNCQESDFEGNTRSPNGISSDSEEEDFSEIVSSKNQPDKSSRDDCGTASLQSQKKTFNHVTRALNFGERTSCNTPDSNNAVNNNISKEKVVDLPKKNQNKPKEKGEDNLNEGKEKDVSKGTESNVVTSTPHGVNNRSNPAHRPTFKIRSSNFSPRKVLNVNNPVSHATFMREVKDMGRQLNGLKITVNKIYNCVCPILETVATSSENDRGIPGLPVNSFEEMVTWEKFLQDHDNALNIVRLLTERCVLTTLKDSVYSMMKFMMTNRLASSFNYKGKNKKGAKISKASFLGTRSCTTLNAALKAYEGNLKKSGTTLNYPTGPTEVGSCIGYWLKDAPKRYLLELKNSKKVPETETNVPEAFLLVPPSDIDLDTE